jgi:6-pyruvoyl-tetrahydropterin synthase
MKFTICKSYKIEYAHRIYNQKKTKSNPDTLCRHLHGHSGVVKIYITKHKRFVTDEDCLDDTGMVVDFTNLKPIKDFISMFDHSTIVSIKDEEMITQIKSTREFFPDMKEWAGVHSSLIFYDRIAFINSESCSSEIIAKVMFEEIQRILEEQVDKELVLERLDFSETDNNVVIVER